MRILIILHQFCPEFSGGTERVAVNLARMAQRAGHYVHVLSCAVNSDANRGQPSTALRGALATVHEGIPVTLLPRSALPATADFSLDVADGLVEPLAAWMRQERFDIAHVLHTMRMGTAVLAAQRCELPYLLTLTDFFLPCDRINLIDLDNKPCNGPDAGQRCASRCMVPPWTARALTNRYMQASSILAAASARVAPSEYAADRYRQIFPELHFWVIPHGIDLPALTAQSVSAEERPVERPLRIGYIGTIVPQKGLDVLLKALARVKSPALKLKVIGGFFGEAFYCNEIQSLAQADPRVEILGQLEPAQVYRIMQTLDLLCLPSRVPESFSLVVQESAAAGVPALVSDLGAPAERIAQGGGGRVLPAGDVDAWAEALAEVADNPQVLQSWRACLPLPLRVEEEAFFYESLYRSLRGIA